MDEKPTMVQIRKGGLKIDFVIRDGQITGLTIDFQKLTDQDEIGPWISALDDVLSAGTNLSAESLPGLLGKRVLAEPHDPPGRAGAKQGGTGPELAYDKVILGAVDKSLDLLGKDGKQSLLNLLERRYGFPVEDIPIQPKAFVAILKVLLGPTASTIEQEIVREIKRVAGVQGATLSDVATSLSNGVLVQ